MKKGTIFFDYDGTLHESMKLYGTALRKAYAWLVSKGIVEPRAFTDEEISHWLGWQVEDMWTTFVPGIEDATWREASRIVKDDMQEGLHAGRGALFEGIEPMLRELHAQGYDLAFLSNCGRPYCDDHLATFGIADLFSATYCAAEFDFIPKWQIYQQVADRHPYPHIMVGDRFHDLEVATRAKIPSIGCAYGYGKPGELEAATFIAQTPSEIPALIESAFMSQSARSERS